MTNWPTAPDIVRVGYVELIVTDLAKSRDFYTNILNLEVTEETEDTIYLKSLEDFLHHNVVLRQGPEAALACFGWRVRSPEEVDKAEAFYKALGCRTERKKEGFVSGIGDAVRVQDPFGFPYEFFYEATHTPRGIREFDKHGVPALVRLDHVNQVTPDLAATMEYLGALGFKTSEQITDEDGTIYATWVHVTSTVHDTSLTAGPGPLLHHIAFAVAERHNVLDLADRIGALRQSHLIERGPGRHGVSNAMYLYLRDPDGFRIEIYTQDYYTGDPDNPTINWDVHDQQRRDWWGNPVVHSWYNEASRVVDLDGNLVPLVARNADSEEKVTVGADGFTVVKGE